MPQYLSPGVYVEYVPPASLPIAGVATSVAGFIGVVDKEVEMPPIPGTVELDKTYKLELESLDNIGSLPQEGTSLVYIAKVNDGSDSFYHILIFDEKGNEVINKGKDYFLPDSEFTSTLDAALAIIDAGSELDEQTKSEIVKEVTASLLSYQVADANSPQLITSWEAFKNNFGDFQEGNKILAHAVYGFFFNGGSRCYVLRVDSPTATNDPLDNPAKELEKFEAVDEITIVAVPGATSQTQQDAIIAHCFNMEDRVAILDGDPTQDPSSISGIRPVGRSEQASYAAIYYPWIKVFDPVSKKNNYIVPPSGHIAGIYARNDATRGVYKAPANYTITKALDVSRPISKAQQDGLNPEGINVIRSFKGTIKVWGARTMADNDNADFRYISTRRYFNYLRESIDENMQFAVFEPNNLALWQKIKRTVGDFLLNEWRDGALFGETPDKAFFVKCDAETNPKQVRELGQVVALIGVAIVKPAEFVIFRIQQTAGE